MPRASRKGSAIAASDDCVVVEGNRERIAFWKGVTVET